MSKFQSFKNTFITVDEIKGMFKLDDYLSLYNKICNSIELGEIEPVKSSNLNGKNPPLHSRYRIIKKEEDNSALIDELTYKVTVDFDVSYYKKHIDKYKEHREYILKLNDFILNHKEELLNPISMNERAFQIWSMEKFLQKGEGKTILKNLGLSLDFLNYYDTSEPLAYYSASKHIPQKVLIIENKDTYYTLRRHLISKGDNILGEDISTVIYGGGKNINKAFKDFQISVEEYVSNRENEILYFGDLDYEGIVIYEGLCRVNHNNYKITPFVKGYEAMISKAFTENIPLQKTKEGQNRNIGDEFLNSFTPEIRKRILEILEEDLYIPQEIININDL